MAARWRPSKSEPSPEEAASPRKCCAASSARCSSSAGSRRRSRIASAPASCPGFLHVAIGQEAIATGVCAALEREDVIASTHRAHGHAIAKGTPVERIMAELYGKVEGCSGGYGGSMHLYDIEVGNLGANAVVGGGLPGIVGAALAFQMRGEKRVAVAFFGDGATNTGTFHESLNLAQLWKVPAIFVLENNGWAESTPATPAASASRRRARQARARIRHEAHRGGRAGRRGRLPRDARRPRARALREGPRAAPPPHAPADGPLRRRSAGLSRQGSAEGGARDEGSDPPARRPARASATTSSRRSTPR